MGDTHAVKVNDELHKVLTPSQTQGETVLVVVSSLSLTAVVLLLFIILVTALRERSQKSSTRIFRSHVTAYFVSLLVSDLLQAVGSIMNLKWIHDMAVSQSGFCSAQGAIKQAADVGTALWISIIAVHTFNVLVLGIHIRRIFMFLVLVGGWSFLGAVVTMGPFILQNNSKGPYFTISGYWCWISKEYETEQFVLEYMMMFLSAVTSFVLYVLVFLKLRGNLLVVGGRFRLRSVDPASAWMSYQTREASASDLRVHMDSIAKHMLLYPIAYIILIVPIAACRFAEWTGHNVPFGAIIFSDSVFLLSGFVNTLLFVLTGRVLPLKVILESLVSREGGFKSRSSSWDSVSTWREKDLPQVPQETYSIARMPYSDSLGEGPQSHSQSETSSLLSVKV